MFRKTIVFSVFLGLYSAGFAVVKNDCSIDEWMDYSTESARVTILISPPYRAIIHDVVNYREVGKLYIKNRRLYFDGDLDKSAKKLFEKLKPMFDDYIKREIRKEK